MVYGEQDSLGYLSNMGVFGKYNMVFFYYSDTLF